MSQAADRYDLRFTMRRLAAVRKDLDKNQTPKQHAESLAEFRQLESKRDTLRAKLAGDGPKSKRSKKKSKRKGAR